MFTCFWPLSLVAQHESLIRREGDTREIRRLEEKIARLQYESQSRITSYNVCYTKLLRVGPGPFPSEVLGFRLDSVKEHGGQAGTDGDVLGNQIFKEDGRITSYNVCYTKLLRLPFHRFDRSKQNVRLPEMK